MATEFDYNKIPWLHIWGSPSYHCEAVIRGNVHALTALRRAIDEALEKGNSEAEVFATDGEGYGVAVQLCNLKSGLGNPPYTAHYVQEHMEYERRALAPPKMPSLRKRAR